MDSMRDKIVTARSFARPASVSEADVNALPAENLPPDAEIRQAQYQQIMQRLQDAADANGDSDVMVTVQDREVSLAQSKLAEKAQTAKPLPSGGQELELATGITGGDWFRWIWSLTNWVDRKDAHAIVRPATAQADPVPAAFSVAMVADWGTGLYGAPTSAATIRKMASAKPFELALHLGDVYYAGTLQECEDRFLSLWPRDAARTSRALNGNHEMYSGGFGYFDEILPAFSQPASYFALQNDNWILACLDTAYVDHDMDTAQVAWLMTILKQADLSRRKLVLFSHQQLFSRLDAQGPKLQKALRQLLDAKAITAWYWGHEHQCVIYDAHPDWGLLGRCLGNGGIPEARKDEVKNAPADPAHPGGGGSSWRRLEATTDSPACIALDGPNLELKNPSDQQKFVPHGFMTLEFAGKQLTERVFLSNGTEIYKNTIG